MHEDVAFGMKLRRLLDLLHGMNFRKDLAQQARLVKQAKSTRGMALSQHAREFVAHTLAGNLTDLWRELLDRSERFGLDSVLETRGKTHRAQHAQLVFHKAGFGITNGANDPGFEIVLASDEVEDLVLLGIEQQAVDGEVTALHVLARIASKLNFIGMASIGVANIAAKGGNLDAEFVGVAPFGSVPLRAQSPGVRSLLFRG